MTKTPFTLNLITKSGPIEGGPRTTTPQAPGHDVEPPIKLRSTQLPRSGLVQRPLCSTSFMFHVVLPGAAKPTRKPILTPMYLNQWDTHFAELLRAGKMEHGSAALAVLAAKRATRSRRAIEAAVRSAHQSGGPIASEARGQRVEERIQGAQFAS